MNKFGLLVLVAFGWLTFTPVTSAHVLTSDGTIGAVMHIDPNDDPIAGQAATFFFEFKDTQGKFSLNACDCNISIQAQGKEIFSSPLSTSASATYTFPQKNIYTISVTGAPKTPGAFQQFTLMYNLRVERVATSEGQPISYKIASTHLIHYIALGIPFIVVFGIYFHDLYRARRKGARVNLKMVVLVVLPALLLHQALLPIAMHHLGIHWHTTNHECCISPTALIAENTTATPFFSAAPRYEVPAVHYIVLLAIELNNKSPPIS